MVFQVQIWKIVWVSNDSLAKEKMWQLAKNVLPYLVFGLTFYTKECNIDMVTYRNYAPLHVEGESVVTMTTPWL